MTTDPFATNADADDLFAAPSTDYVEIADLDGRLVAVFPKRVEQGVGKSDGKQYDKVIADVIVIDGEVTDKIPTTPHTITEMHFSSKMVVGQLRAYVGKGRPVLARVNSKPSSFNRNVKAFGLGPATEGDKGKALPAAQEYMQQDMFAN